VFSGKVEFIFVGATDDHICIGKFVIFNFTNILRAAFARLDPKSAKRQSSHQRLFAHFGIYALKSS